jgi:hypothetical protein
VIGGGGSGGGCRKAGSAMVLSRVCIDMHEFDRGCPDANYFRGHGDQSSTALSNFLRRGIPIRGEIREKGAEVKPRRARAAARAPTGSRLALSNACNIYRYLSMYIYVKF